METNHIVKNLKDFNKHDWKAFESKLKEKTELYNEVMFSINEDFKTIYKYVSSNNIYWDSDEDWSIKNIKLIDPDIEPIISNVSIVGLEYNIRYVPSYPIDNTNYTIGIDWISCINNKEITLEVPITSLLSIEGYIHYENEDDDFTEYKHFRCTDYEQFCKQLETEEYTHYYSRKVLTELKKLISDEYEELSKSYKQFITRMIGIFKIYLKLIALNGSEFREYMLKYNWNIEFDMHGNVIRKL